MLGYLTQSKRREYRKLVEELPGADDGRRPEIEKRLAVLRAEAATAAERLNPPLYDPTDSATWDQELLHLARLAGLIS